MLVCAAFPAVRVGVVTVSSSCVGAETGYLSICFILGVPFLFLFNSSFRDAWPFSHITSSVARNKTQVVPSTLL